MVAIGRPDKNRIIATGKEYKDLHFRRGSPLACGVTGIVCSRCLVPKIFYISYIIIFNKLLTHSCSVNKNNAVRVPHRQLHELYDVLYSFM